MDINFYRICHSVANIMKNYSAQFFILVVGAPNKCEIKLCTQIINMLKEKERCSKYYKCSDKNRNGYKDKKHRYCDDHHVNNSIYDSKCMHNNFRPCIHLNAKCVENSNVDNYNYLDFDYGPGYYYMNHVNSDRGSVHQA